MTCKFTPPTKFPAEYVTGNGERVILLGITEDQRELIGYRPDNANIHSSWKPNGNWLGGSMAENDLHDIPKRVKTYHNRYSFGIIGNHESVSEANFFCKGNTRTHVYVIERDEDGSNPTIEAIDVRGGK